VRNLHIFEIQNNGLITTHSLGVLGMDWQIVGTGDFDADGDADILLTRDVAEIRHLLSLEIQDNTVIASHEVSAFSNSVRVDGIGDFDLDGDADLTLDVPVFSSDGTPAASYLTYEIQDHAVVSSHNVGTVGLDWLIT
jgi:hypothetical protein